MDDRASDIQVVGRVDQRGEEILTPDALAFVEELQRRFGGRRDELLRLGASAAKRCPGRQRRISFPRHGRCVRRHGPWLRHRPISSIDESRSRTPRTENGDQRAEFRVARLVGRPGTPLIGRTSYPARSHLPMRCAGA